ncbi:hypothetical protein V5O48_008099 [Marasmius crinis-equi]|uniref:ABC transmembrane type-1 domain-containing protein n=1 Tax=Marasmius crinis-equi TaxID=585013 RepID=A0ABR3FF98_9AGAR
MFAMTVYKCGSALYLARHGGGLPLILLFMRDGIFWFLAVFAVMVPQAVIVAAARITLGEAMINMCLATYSIISSRVLLNIREIMIEAERLSTGLSHSENTMQLETIEFQGTEFTTITASEMS